jgi:hypothetical protein
MRKYFILFGAFGWCWLSYRTGVDGFVFPSWWVSGVHLMIGITCFMDAIKQFLGDRA